jgi:hypothetical protein
MQKFLQNKTGILILAIIGILALAGLASGIREMSFRAADPFIFAWPSSFQQLLSFKPATGSTVDVPFWKLVLFLGAIAGLLIIFVVMLPPKLRKLLIRAIIRTFIFVICLYYAMRLSGKKLFDILGAAASIGQGQNGENGVDPSQFKFTAPAQTPIAGYIASLVVVSVIIILVWLFIRFRNRMTGDIRKEISKIARETILELSESPEWGDTITRCYVRMTNAVVSARGIKRGRGMTPSEFSEKLAKAGLPGEPIQRLTSLFERVRYGEKTPTPLEQQEAIFCLNDIIHACGGEV